MAKAKAKPKPQAKQKAVRFDKVRMCVDVLPPPDEWERFTEIAKLEDPTNVVLGVSQAMTHPNRAVLLSAAKWANGREIKIAFLGGTGKQQDFVKAVASEWPKHVNLPFKWGVPAAQSDVRIAFQANSGAWSFMGNHALGIAKSQPTMNLGWLDPATVLHEFGHMLGLAHEHQHPEGGIPWDKAAVYAYYAGPPNYWDREAIDHNVLQVYSVGQTQFSKFDKKSVMLYPVDAALLTDPSFAVGWNKELSATDTQFMAGMYPRPDAPPPPSTGGVTIPASGTYKVQTVGGKPTLVFNP